MSADGKRIIAGRYEILSELGSGTYGVVYQAYDPVLDKTVAIKMLHMEENDPAHLIRFQKEARAIAKLKHKNIISVMDFNLDSKNDLYLVLEYVEGENLRELIDRFGTMTIDDAMPFLTDILDGLGHAHANGVVHRDLNPRNVLIDRSNPEKLTVKIVDFGLAQLSSNDQKLTRTGAGVGSPAYMAPEQGRAEQADPRSDIYSFGCLMFAMLTGRPPHQADTAIDTIMAHINKDAPRLIDAKPDGVFSEQLEIVVAKTLARDPKERYQTCEELADALTKSSETVEPTIANEELFENNLDAVTGIHFDSKTPVSNKGSKRALVLTLCAVLVMVPLTIYLVKQALIPPTVSKTSFSNNGMIGDIDACSLSYRDTYERWELKFCQNDELIKFVRDSTHKDEIMNLSILDATQVTGRGLKYLAGLNKLAVLTIEHSALDDKGLTFLPPLPELKTLNIEDASALKGRTLVSLKSKLPKLDVLNLSATAIDDKALEEIAKIPTITTLNLQKSWNIKGYGLYQLTKLPKLTNLDLRCSGFDLRYLNFLEQMPRVDTLNVSEMRLDVNACRTISKLRHLHWIAFHNSIIDNQGFELIVRNHPTLTAIGMAQCPDLDWQALKAIDANKVTSMELDSMPLPDEAIELICTWKNLERLQARECQIDLARADKILSKLPVLKELQVSAGDINNKDLESLRKKYKTSIEAIENERKAMKELGTP